jgi:hypothetical protein
MSNPRLKPTSVARLRQHAPHKHPLAELVTGEHLERPVRVPLAPVDIGDGPCRVVAYLLQLLGVTSEQVVRVEEPLFGAAERRRAPLPFDTDVPVCPDYQVLGAAELGLGVEDDEGPGPVTALLPAPGLPSLLGDSPCAKGDVHRLGERCHSSPPITPRA